MQTPTTHWEWPVLCVNTCFSQPKVLRRQGQQPVLATVRSHDTQLKELGARARKADARTLNHEAASVLMKILYAAWVARFDLLKATKHVGLPADRLGERRWRTSTPPFLAYIWSLEPASMPSMSWVYSVHLVCNETAICAWVTAHNEMRNTTYTCEITHICFGRKAGNEVDPSKFLSSMHTPFLT